MSALELQRSEDVFDILQNARAELEASIKKDPALVLSEVDLQCQIYNYLRGVLPERIEYKGLADQTFMLGRVYTEYRLETTGFTIIPDVVIVDREALKSHEPIRAPKCEHGYLWRMPVSGMVELKYCGFGDYGPKVRHGLYKDIVKLQKWSEITGQNPYVWLVGYNQYKSGDPFEGSQLARIRDLKKAE